MNFKHTPFHLFPTGTFLRTSLLLALLSMLLSAKEPEKKLLSGGMGYSLGYGKIHHEANSYTSYVGGLGGRLLFHLTQYFRIGVGGSSATLSYSTNQPMKSNVSGGYGGLISEFSFQKKSWIFSGGIQVGGVSLTSLHLINNSSEGEIYTAHYQKKSSLLLSPIITIEKKLAKSINVMLAVDWIQGVSLAEPNIFTYPRLHLGFLFSH